MDNLTEKMNKMAADADIIFQKALEEGRELTAEENAQWDKAKVDLLGMRKTINSAKELAEMHFSKNIEEIKNPQTQFNPSKDVSEKAEREQFNNYLRTGDRQNFVIDSQTDGGALIPRSVDTPIIVRRMWNAILNACLAMNQPIIGQGSDSTATIVLPVMDDTSIFGTDISEYDEVDDPADPTVTTVTLGAVLTDSKTLWFSNTILKALPYDLAAYLLPILDKRCLLQMDVDWTAKLLAGPVGEAEATTITTASTNALTYTEFVKFYHALAPQFRTDGVYIISDGLASVIEQLVDTYGRPLFSDPLVLGAVKSLRGCPVFISNSLLAPSNSVVSGVFVSAGSLYPRICGNKRIAMYQNLPNYRDMTGYAQFVNSDFGVSPGVAYLQHHS
jgi:HK97 family phage major capsid protein